MSGEIAERDLEAANEEIARLTEALYEYGQHAMLCDLHICEAGRPTADGYEMKYRGTWYKADRFPKCECGLDEALGEAAGKGGGG